MWGEKGKVDIIGKVGWNKEWMEEGDERLRKEGMGRASEADIKEERQE